MRQTSFHNIWILNAGLSQKPMTLFQIICYLYRVGIKNQITVRKITTNVYFNFHITSMYKCNTIRILTKDTYDKGTNVHLAYYAQIQGVNTHRWGRNRQTPQAHICRFNSIAKRVSNPWWLWSSYIFTNNSLPRIYNGKVIDVREDILQFWYGVSDTEYLLLSWPSQIIVRWFSKDILAKHPLTEVVRSLGLQNINFTLYHHNKPNLFVIIMFFLSLIR